MDNKKNKVIIGILVAIIICLAIALVAVFAIGDKEEVGKLVPVTELVTDEQGEAVTDAEGELVTVISEGVLVEDTNGNAVTEVVTNKNKQPYTHKNGSPVTHHVTEKHKTPSSTKKSGKTDKKDNSTTTTKKGNGNNNTPAPTDNNTSSTNKNESSTKDTVKVPNPPAKVTGVKISDIKKDSAKISWNKVDCDSYNVQYKSANDSTWKDAKESPKSNSITIKNLDSNTNYTIRVCAIKDYPGSTRGRNGDWSDETTFKTEINKEPRQINITYKLPVKGHSDTLVVKVLKDGKDEEWETDRKIKIDVCDGKIYSVKTKEEYKGLVKVKLVLENSGISATSSFTDKDILELDLIDTNIEIIQGEDD